MASSTNVSDSKTLNRPPNPAPIYGPMVYQFPPEDYEVKKAQRSEGGASLLVLFMTIVLVMGGVYLYLKESGVDVKPIIERQLAERQLSYGSVSDGPMIQGLQSRVATSARVAASRLYLREGPGANYVPIYLLPYNWPLSILGESQVSNDGEVWIKVGLQTEQGPQEGWVNRKYVQSMM
jgi:hypothetical protein